MEHYCDIDMTEVEPRYRIAAKQTAKNIWQLDATAEAGHEEITIPLSEKVVGNNKKVKLGWKSLQFIKDTEESFRNDDR